jgi:aspartate-semialdehyde dehydrogenase
VQSIESRVFPAQIAFNAIPAIGEFEENGFTIEEMKMVWETHKIFEDDSIQVSPTCVRIPVFYGHSEAVYIETRKSISAETARQLFADFPGIEVVDDVKANIYPTAVAQAAGSDPVYVGRIRKDVANELGLHCWVVSDNVRKGAALNSVQIAEHLIEQLL